MNILALSGSLRAASQNTMLLRAVARLAPEGIKVIVYPGLGELPLFNPDIEFPNPPAVASLREAIMAADALIIASPEYAHGVTGAIKNALDWMVGNESCAKACSADQCGAAGDACLSVVARNGYDDVGAGG